MRKYLLLSFCFTLFFTAGAQEERDTLFPYRQGAKWGFANRKLKVVIPAQFDTAYFFDETFTGKNTFLARVVSQKKVGLVNTKGKLVVPCRHEKISVVFWGYVFSDKDKMGLYTLEGKLVAPAKYDEISYAKDFYYIVDVGNKKGLLNPGGKLILPAQYSYIYVDKTYIKTESEDGLVKYFDRLGKEINYTPEDVSDQLMMAPVDMYDDPGKNKTRINKVFREGDKYGYIYHRVDWPGGDWNQDTIPARYDSIIDGYRLFKFFPVKQNGKWRIVDTKGNPDNEIRQEFDGIGMDVSLYQSEGQIPVKGPQGWGTVLYDGKIIMPMEYDEIKFLQGSGNYFLTRKGSRRGAALMHQGKLHVIPAKYVAVGTVSYSFGEPLVLMKSDTGKWGWVGMYGNEYFRN